MDGLGTDEQSIINTLITHSNSFRQQIKSSYKTKYNKDLIKNLKSELSGNFEDTIIALLKPPKDYDMLEIHSAIPGAGKKKVTLIEIISKRRNWVLQKIQHRYKTKYNTELIEDIKVDTSGVYNAYYYRYYKMNAVITQHQI